MKRKRKKRCKNNGRTRARVELLGATILLVENAGHFDLLGVNPEGGTTTLLSSPENSKMECLVLMHNAVDILCAALGGAATVFKLAFAEQIAAAPPDRVDQVMSDKFGPFHDRTSATRPFSPHENN